MNVRFPDSIFTSQQPQNAIRTWYKQISCSFLSIDTTIEFNQRFPFVWQTIGPARKEVTVFECILRVYASNKVVWSSLEQSCHFNSTALKPLAKVSVLRGMKLCHDSARPHVERRTLIQSKIKGGTARAPYSATEVSTDNRLNRSLENWPAGRQTSLSILWCFSCQELAIRVSCRFHVTDNKFCWQSWAVTSLWMTSKRSHRTAFLSWNDFTLLLGDSQRSPRLSSFGVSVG